MVIWETLKRVRGEYSNYLRKAHPEWEEDTVKAHAAGAFYMYSNNIAVAFWKCFESDESMAAAREEMVSYLAQTMEAEQAKAQADYYLGEMERLKAFLDEKGGVKAYIGPEYDCEETIYQYAKMAYEGAITADEAAEALSEKVPYSKATIQPFISMFEKMAEGKRITYIVGRELIIYFITRMGEDYGKEGMAKALKSVWDVVRQQYKTSGKGRKSLRLACAKMAETYQIDLDFGDGMFEGIVPDAPSDTILAGDGQAVRYWLYAAGANWEKDYADGVMAIRWSELGDLTQYDSKEDIRTRLRALYGTDSSCKNNVLNMWQFANVIKPGDIVFVIKGSQSILGRGIVEGDYTWDPQRGDYCNVRKMNWTDKGEWTYTRKLATKTLTDITSYRDDVKGIQELIDGDNPSEAIQDEAEKEPDYDPYTEEDFLRDVFMDEEHYEELKTLLLRKKNVIFQGAPGVGKTFAAKRLVYSIMGEKDSSRVQMVQFHQSYSYEDFIMGYRPTETGFVLKTGVFYDFCRQAAEDDDRPYFFIIDEINRGNLSKIFGELFMLLENDKRGVELGLLYANEQFSIPKNVYLLGMMNTADRSLAMMDYALRRRFAFFTMEPAFDSAGFRRYQKEQGSAKFDRLIDTVKALNQDIADDESLGEGFCIGHSYFCTRERITDEWLTSVVKTELIPLLKEYWFDEKEKVKTWSDRLLEAVQ